MTRGQGVSAEPAEGRGSRCAGALGAPMSPAVPASPQLTGGPRRQGLGGLVRRSPRRACGAGGGRAWAAVRGRARLRTLRRGRSSAEILAGGVWGDGDARGSFLPPPSRRPAQTRRAEGKGCESGRALVRGGVAGTAVRGSGPAGGRGGQPSCRPSRVAGRGERTALGNRSPEPRAGTLARKERGRETLAVASRPRAPVRGAESR